MAVSEYLDPDIPEMAGDADGLPAADDHNLPSRSTKVDFGPSQQEREARRLFEDPSESNAMGLQCRGEGSGRYGLTRTVELRHLSLLEADTLVRRCVLLSLGHAISDIDLSFHQHLNPMIALLDPKCESHTYSYSRCLAAELMPSSSAYARVYPSILVCPPHRHPRRRQQILPKRAARTTTCSRPDAHQPRYQRGGVRCWGSAGSHDTRILESSNGQDCVAQDRPVGADGLSTGMARDAPESSSVGRDGSAEDPGECSCVRVSMVLTDAFLGSGTNVVLYAHPIFLPRPH